MNDIKASNGEYLEQIRAQLDIRESSNQGFSTKLNCADCGALSALLTEVGFSDTGFIEMLNKRAKSGTGSLISLTVENVKELNTALKKCN